LESIQGPGLVEGVVDKLVKSFAICDCIVQERNFADPVPPEIGCIHNFVLAPIEFKPLRSNLAAGREYCGDAYGDVR